MNDLNLAMIQRYLGHRRIETTIICEIDGVEFERVVEFVERGDLETPPLDVVDALLCAQEVIDPHALKLTSG